MSSLNFQDIAFWINMLIWVWAPHACYHHQVYYHDVKRCRKHHKDGNMKI